MEYLKIGIRFFLKVVRIMAKKMCSFFKKVLSELGRNEMIARGYYIDE